MALKVAIDGYNLLGASTGMGLGISDVEGERDALVRRLGAYKRIRGVKVTVVFDGTRGGRLRRSREVIGGVEVIFSRSGEEADDILKRMAREKGPGLTIVTSDREVVDSAVGSGSVVLRSGEFLELLEGCEYEELKGGPLYEDGGEGADGDDYGQNTGAKKKGPSRRPPKGERKKRGRLKKL